jgi:hypothetical protein
MAISKAVINVELSNARIVQPGDKLVLGFRKPLGMAEVDRIKQRVAENLPGVEVVIVDDITGMAVYKPDAEHSLNFPPADGEQGARIASSYLKRYPTAGS